MLMKNGLFCLTLFFYSLYVGAYYPADQQASFYEGLQDYERIFEILEPDLTQEIATNANPNYLRRLLAPWDKDTVNLALNQFHKDVSPEKRALLRPFLDSDPIKSNTLINNMHPVTWEILMTAAKVALKGRYFASGLALNETHQKNYGQLLLQSSHLKHFNPSARAITLSDAPIQFVPSDEFITNNLYEGGNSASDQKNSEMILPINTPVFVLGQYFDQALRSPETDSWLAIWRPEFHIRFVRSSHIALMSNSEVSKYEDMASNNLYMTVTGRVRVSQGLYAHKPLIANTPILKAGSGYYLASTDETLKNQKSRFKLFNATLVKSSPKVIDANNQLEDHLREVPLAFTVWEYLNQLHRTTFHNPRGTRNNLNVSFGWGEAIIGPDNFYGQDVSSFIRKLLLPFGISLTRDSREQLEEGLSHFPIYDSTTENISDQDSLYQALVDFCKLGRFVSFGPGSIAACLGSVSLEELHTLDPKAALEAKQIGGIKENDKVPLLAMSPIGFKDQDGWHITPKTGVYPVFKKSYYNAWVTRGKLFIFSYFTPN